MGMVAPMKTINFLLTMLLCSCHPTPEPPPCDDGLDCTIYGCACVACPPPQGYGEIMCPGNGDPGPMIADSAYCPDAPDPRCVLSDVTWTCPSGATVRPWCCPWPDWSDGSAAPAIR
jgi:hypothetical protein